MIVLTFDTDWAPQFVIDYVIDTLNENGVNATFFFNLTILSSGYQ